MIKPERTGKLKRGATAEECESGIARKKQRSSIDSGCPEDGTGTPGFSKVGGGGMGGLSHVRKDREKPAEQLFRKDLISAMKMADTEPLQSDEYIVITDPWRMDWEKGVQVPVHPDEMPYPNVRLVEGKENWHGLYSFKLPRKYLHATHDETYIQGIHELHEMHQLADQVCRYDLDELDVAWLMLCNAERELMGELPVEEWMMERVLEEIEQQCHNNMQTMIKTVDGLGIEYDENVVCDVCRSPESEDCNEMVFCDSCDICVHQACYGIQKIPEGSWLCRVCALGIKPRCILCPNTGGAMKSTRSGSKWAHVSCALWIPEVSIGCPEKMEPITKISHIPSSRWALTCSLCRDRTGACIQCAVKTCKTAFHVTCAIQHSLDMKTILDDKNDDVQLKAYCEKHTKKKDGDGTPRKNEGVGKGMKECGMTEQEKNELRSHRLEKLAKEFYLCVQAKDIAQTLQLDEDTVDFIYNYWMLKRRANFNKPLLMPKMEEEDRLSKQKENSLLARMKMFVHLRQDLERVRNLCYMVSRREKLRRQLYNLKQQIFQKQVQLVNSSDLHNFGTRDKKALVGAHRLTGSVYDQPDGILRMARLAEIAVAETDAASLLADGGAPTRERHHHGRRHHDRGNDSLVKGTTGGVCVLNRTRHFSDCLSEVTTPKKGIGSSSVRSPQHDGSLQTDTLRKKKLRSPLRKAQDVAMSCGPNAAATRSSQLRKLPHSPRTCRNNNNNRYNRLRHKRRKRCSFSAMMNKCDTERRAGFSAQRPKRNGIVVAGSRRLVVGDNIREKVQSRLQNSTKPYGVLNGLRERVQRKIESFFQRSDDSGSNTELKENEPVIVADAAPPSGKTDKSSDNAVIGCDLFHQNIFSDAIHGNGSAFGQIAKQAGFGSGVPVADSVATTPTRSAKDSESSDRGMPEVRRVRQKIASSIEAGNSSMLYETANGYVRPRCNTPPTKEVTFSPFGSGKKLSEALRTNDSETDLSDDDISNIGSEGGATIMPEDTDDNDSSRNVFLSMRSLRSKSQRNEAVADDLSVDGSTASSSSRYSTRSRLADNWSKITGACS